jgi:hypothetical protein
MLSIALAAITAAFFVSLVAAIASSVVSIRSVA